MNIIFQTTHRNQIQLVRFGGQKMLRGYSLDQENLGRIAALFAGATVDHIQLQSGPLRLEKHFGSWISGTIPELRSLPSRGTGRPITNPGPDFTSQPDDIVVLWRSQGTRRAMNLLTKNKAKR